MWPNQHFPADLVTFTAEIFNGKLHFCRVHILWNIYDGVFDRVLKTLLQLLEVSEISELCIKDFA